jgi:hypothetical protein
MVKSFFHAGFFTLKMEICFSEPPADFHWTTWGYIPADRSLNNHQWENIKS